MPSDLQELATALHKALVSIIVGHTVSDIEFSDYTELLRPASIPGSNLLISAQECTNMDCLLMASE